MVSAALGFPWFTTSPSSLPLKEGGEFLNGYTQRQQSLLCIEPLNITATWWLLTNSFRLWSALGSHESHWLQAKHNNPEQGTVTASFVNNGTSTSATSATEKQWQIIKFLPRRKLLQLLPRCPTSSLHSLAQDECHNRTNFRKLVCVCSLASSYPRLDLSQW